MTKLLLRILVLLLPLAARAQAPAGWQLQSIIGTPLFAPTDIAVDSRGYMYVLEGDPYFSYRPGTITKLDPQGRYVERLDVKRANTGPSSICTGYALAMDAADNLYVADAGQGEIRKYSPAGQPLQTFRSNRWGFCSPVNPRALTVDAAGNVYALSNNRLLKFNSQGALQWEYAPPLTSQPGRADIRLSDVAADAAGNVFVITDYYVITKLNAAGQVQQTIPVTRAGQYIFSTGSFMPVMNMDAAGSFYLGIEGGSPIYKFAADGTYQSSLPTDVFGGGLNFAFDRQNQLYVSAASNRGEAPTIYKFAPTGTELARWSSRDRALFITQNGAGEFYSYDAGRQQIIKRAADGRELLRFGGPGYGTGQFEPNIAGSVPAFAGLDVDAAGNVYTLEENYNSSPRVQVFDGQGRWLRVIQSSALTRVWPRFAALTVTPAGQIYVADLTNHRVVKLNQQGQLLQTLGASGNLRFYQPQAMSVNELGLLYVADSSGSRVQQISPTGQLLRSTHVRIPNRNYLLGQNPVDVDVDGNGTIFINNSAWDSVRVLDRQGRQRRCVPKDFGPVSALSVDAAGSRLLTLRQDASLVCAYGAPAGGQPACQIVGRVYQDLNGDCLNQSSEPGLADIIVVAQPGNYYARTDAAGGYVIRVDTGRYTVQQLLPVQPGRTIQTLCPPGPPILPLTAAGQSVYGPDFGNQVTNAPYLSVEVGSNRRRRCARNVTTVRYANTGFAAAANAQVVVALPQHVVFIGADRPHTRDAQGNFVFSVGTLAPEQGGTIVIQDSVACGNPAIRGLTVCTRAWITPSNTYPPSTRWNQASLRVRGAALAGNETRFSVVNVGRGATTDSLQLRVYQDAQLGRLERFMLAAGDSLVLRVPATGRVVRVEADQPAEHPLKKTASANVELPGAVTGGVPSPAMSAWPPDDAEPEVAESCEPIVDSFDPNDKQVVPAGVTAQHYTPTGVPLRYRIRFQNTGTDDAYRVVLVDTLSAHLDMSTLQVGAASHPYRLSVGGKGRAVLTFTFAGLTLPPSSRNEPASHGFVEFTVKPKSGLAPRTQVDNYADIFFDYNEPVRTNTTTNRIYDVPPTVGPGAPLGPVVVSPAVTGVAPAQGRFGTLVTITGQRFATTPAANQVRFNGTAAPVLSATATTLTVRVPAGASSGPLQVSTADGGTRSPQAFTVFQPPVLTTLSPAEGRPGDVVTLSGSHFSALAAQDTVFFNGVAARVRQASTTQLEVEVPAGATLGPVLLRTLGGEVRSSQNFMVWYAPVIASLSPAKGKAGSVVTLTGSAFAPAARSTVAFTGGAPGQVLQASATSLQVRVPAAAQSGPLRLETPGGTVVSTTAFTFVPAPVLTSFTPTQAAVGELVTLTGQHLLADGLPDTIAFAGARAEVLSATTTSAVVRVPRGAVTGPLEVAGSGGRGTSQQVFTVLALQPEEAIGVYPNPTNGHLTLDWQRADFDVEQVTVYNTLGQRVLGASLRAAAQPQLQLDLTAQRKGLYLLVVQTARGLVTKHLTVY
ncbi:T9SS type A sorting domain-containing protein [Hymenobacter gummosus]|uniref:T9SS type A sorting domain-containing protein n=1 Tax=Hymenobacter gummosus TaxID=1776032 RepID=A0A431U0B7_9BACT|nr:IPT/TIG domain-containing protein [Hymenobacter gummosus]RTQ48135.1 T9SS type A sorting domain-containing protein [Hymenobacter gummosus]